jgi:hypothetical protein
METNITLTALKNKEIEWQHILKSHVSDLLKLQKKDKKRYDTTRSDTTMKPCETHNILKSCLINMDTNFFYV